MLRFTVLTSILALLTYAYSYLAAVKKCIITITLFLFMLSTVIMPYANYDDVQSLCAVYNNCLKQDADMNLLEFIGEKLLMTGFDPEEKEELPNPHSKQNPVNENAIVQIQSGVLFQVAKEEINLSRTEIVRKNIPTKNTVFFTQEFNPGIFHPPAILAS